MNRNTIIKIEHKEYPTYMATYSEAKKYFLCLTMGSNGIILIDERR